MSQRLTAPRTAVSPALVSSGLPKPKSRPRRPSLALQPTDHPPVLPRPAERGPSDAELEFMQAMHDYKKSSGRMFPTWSEVLEVLKALGYAKNL